MKIRPIELYWFYYSRELNAWMGWYEPTLPPDLRGRALRLREWKIP